MTIFANNVFVSVDPTVKACGALAVLKKDTAPGAVALKDVERFNALDNSEGVVFVAPFMTSILTSEEMEVILAHEQAHIYLGHLAQYEGETGIVDNVKMEIEADAEAAKLFGSATVCSALGKTISTVLENVRKAIEPDDEEWEVVNQQAMRSVEPRFAALRAI